jgi:signal transduction histidine kinase
VDAAKTERIVENLIANAMKHTPAGTPIAVSATRDGAGVLIRVDDGGPGIPDERKREIFELFTRGGTDASAVPGTGIGLALVAQFAALQGGRAWVEDRGEGGSSFRVALPGERRRQPG